MIDYEALLLESGVANDLSHYEDGKLHTAITSIEELKKLIRLAYDAGTDAGYSVGCSI
jgi:hypothetical protein